jgi:hypothetical protein
MAFGFFIWMIICVACLEDGALAKILALEMSSLFPQ